MVETIDYKAIVKSAGLSSNGAAVYLACLQLGPSTASSISKASGVARGIIYNYLDELCSKGLAAITVKNGVKYFSPQSPAALLALVKRRELAIEMAVPALLKLKNAAPPPLLVSYVSGVGAIKAMLDEIAGDAADCEFCTLLSTLDYLPLMGDAFVRFNRKRARKGIHARMIFREDDRGAGEVDARRAYPLTTVRFVKIGQNIDTSVSIYGKVVVIYVWAAEPSCIKIENPEVTRTMQAYFDILWNQAKPPARHSPGASSK